MGSEFKSLRVSEFQSSELRAQSSELRAQGGKKNYYLK
jgi:hypothetical protein